MKTFLILLFATITGSNFAQSIIATSTSIDFFSSTSMEDIKAINKAATALIVPAKGDLLFNIPVRNFKFTNSLMEEHFNENYIETDKFPTAKFQGKINEAVDYNKEAVNKISVTGKMTVHGVTQDKTYAGTLTIKDGKIITEAKFDLMLKDYNIEIPKLVTKNVSEQVAVNVKAEFPLQK